jgi:putative peptidoglycan lipid II flippase
MNLLKATATIGSLTLVSRVLGFGRDLLLARYLGAGFASDAFLVAFRLPNLFRALFAEGAFAAAFVPAFSRALEAEGPGAARRLGEEALAVLAAALLALSALMLVAAGPIVWLLTGGFEDRDPAKVATTTEYARLAFPYLALISLGALFGGVLNALHRFWVAAAAPILLNLFLLATLVVLRDRPDVEIARWLCVAVTLAGLAQFLWLAWSARRAGMAFRLRWPRLTPDVKRLLAIFGPAVLGAGATQVNLLVSTLLAARFLPQGSVSWLYYADRLNQLPLGLIGIGVGTALLPALSRLLGGGETDKANAQHNRAIELALLLAVPAAVALVVAAEPIIRGLLQHGAFTAQDGTATAAALAAFALGLPAYILIKVLAPGFYARQDTRTPVRIALVAVAVNLVGNLVLIWPLAHVGPALATALSAWVNAALLYLTLRRRGWLALDARTRRVALRILAAAAVMAAAAWALGRLVLPWVTGGALERAGGLALLVGGGVAAYGAAALALGVAPIDAIRRRLARRGPPPLPASE